MSASRTVLLLLLLAGGIAGAWLALGDDGLPVYSAHPLPIEEVVSEDGGLASTYAAPPEPARAPAAGFPDGLSGSERGTLLVEVVVAGSGAPVRGAALTCRARDGQAGEGGSWEEASTAGPSGGASFLVPPGRTLALRVRPAGSRRLRAGVVAGGDEPLGVTRVLVEPLAPGERREVAVELDPASLLVFHGRVVRRDSGAPVPRASVELLPAPGESAVPLDRCAADGDGRFRFTTSAAYASTVRASASGFVPLELAVAAGHEQRETELELRLAPAAALRARLIDALGRPAEGATLRVALAAQGSGQTVPAEQRWSRACDDAGLVQLAELPAGFPLEVTLLDQDGDPTRRFAAPLVLRPGERREVEWVLYGGRPLSGRLVGEDGEALAGVELLVLPIAQPQPDGPRQRYFSFSRGDARGRAFAAPRTGPDGRFALREVPFGELWIGPAPEPGAGARDPRAASSLATRVAVAPGESEIEVELTAQRGLYLSGRVLDPDDAPAPGVLVQAEPAGAGGVLAAMSGADGGFLLGPLSPGEFSLRALGGDAYDDSPPVRASGGARDVVLRLLP